MFFTKNRRGNISIALLVVLVAVMSGISLAAIAFRDTVAYGHQLEGIQQFHYIRSEVGRGRLAGGYQALRESPMSESLLPLKTRTVKFSRSVYNYRAKTRISGQHTKRRKKILIRTLLSAIRGRGKEQLSGSGAKVQKYAENQIHLIPSLAIYHSFTDKHEGVEGVPGNIRFSQDDVIHGRVHSNSDLWIQKNSWPTFHGLVSTSGRIRVHPGGGTTYPRDQIFMEGLLKNTCRIVFDSKTSKVRNNGMRLFYDKEYDDRIAFVTIEGKSFRSKIGQVKYPEENQWIEGVNQFTIYNTYPPYGPVGDSICVNRISMPDTVWTEHWGGAVSDQSVWVPMELWISGEVSGSQTWASSHNIYIKDDITYTNTKPGLRPDGIDESGNQTLPINTRDYFGLISEESIWIQYGHFCPVDSVRKRPNTDNVYLYGAFCALGKGDNYWEDGVLSYQYQYPKGSTPSQYWKGERFTNIDLHRFKYPASSMWPWPLGLDYPLYNPLWPEPGKIYGTPEFPTTPNPHNVPEVVKHRGRIWLFGSVAQRRMGRVRRSGNPDFDTGLWDIDNSIMPNTPPRYGAPAPAIGETGYDKHYHFDRRFIRSSPPDYPNAAFEGDDLTEIMDLGYLKTRWVFKNPPPYF